MTNDQASETLSAVKAERSPYYYGSDNPCRASLVVGTLSPIVCESATEASVVWSSMVRKDKSLRRVAATCTHVATDSVVWEHNTAS